MLKIITWIGFGVVILGVIIASEPLPILHALPLGLFMIGIGLAAVFLDTLLTGKITFFRRASDSYSYQGLAGYLWGAEMIFIGGAIAFAALMEWLSPGWVLVWIKTPVGLAQLLIGSGLVVSSAGVVNIIGTVENRESKTAFLLSLPSRLFGLLIILAGLLVLGLGFFQLAAPGALGGWIKELIPPIPTPPVISG